MLLSVLHKQVGGNKEAKVRAIVLDLFALFVVAQRTLAVEPQLVGIQLYFHAIVLWVLAAEDLGLVNRLGQPARQRSGGTVFNLQHRVQIGELVGVLAAA